MAIEPFELHDNLMLAGGVIASGGCIITETTPHAERYTSLIAFERCVDVRCGGIAPVSGHDTKVQVSFVGTDRDQPLCCLAQAGG